MAVKHGSLFAGIGGFDLGFERAGIETVWQVEINGYCREVLRKHFPRAKRYRDVRKCGAHNLRPVDIITGGFPCQDVSWAGPRIGIGGKRSGLWREMHRIICELRPSLVLVENVPGLLHRGFWRVLGDLAGSGFDAEWSLLSACSMGAPHPRARLFILAYPKGERPGQLRWSERPEEGKENGHLYWPQPEPGIARVADGVPNRVDRITALGNAVVPQVAEWIALRILACEMEAR